MLIGGEATLITFFFSPSNPTGKDLSDLTSTVLETSKKGFIIQLKLCTFVVYNFKAFMIHMLKYLLKTGW